MTTAAKKPKSPTTKSPKLTTPVNGPGCSYSKAKTKTATDATDRANALKKPDNAPPNYPWPHVGPAPGIAADRMAPYSLPSRVGQKLYYPGGRVEDLK